MEERRGVESELCLKGWQIEYVGEKRKVRL